MSCPRTQQNGPARAPNQTTSFSVEHNSPHLPHHYINQVINIHLEGKVAKLHCGKSSEAHINFNCILIIRVTYNYLFNDFKPSYIIIPNDWLWNLNCPSRFWLNKLSRQVACSCLLGKMFSQLLLFLTYSLNLCLMCTSTVKHFCLVEYQQSPMWETKLRPKKEEEEILRDINRE